MHHCFFEENDVKKPISEMKYYSICNYSLKNKTASDVSVHKNSQIYNLTVFFFNQKRQSMDETKIVDLIHYERDKRESPL